MVLRETSPPTSARAPGPRSPRIGALFCAQRWGRARVHALLHALIIAESAFRWPPIYGVLVTRNERILKQKKGTTMNIKRIILVGLAALALGLASIGVAAPSIAGGRIDPGGAITAGGRIDPGGAIIAGGRVDPGGAIIAGGRVDPGGAIIAGGGMVGSDF
jgi:hypothetical protein